MAEAIPADTVLESPGARQPTVELTAATDVLGGNKWATAMMDGSATKPAAMAETVESLEATTGAADVMSESRAERPTVSVEQAACPKML